MACCYNNWANSEEVNDMELRQPIQEPIIIPPSEAAEYLAKRDIKVDLLTNGLHVGFTQRRNCSRFHPVTAPGYHQWSETNAEIRRSFCAEGQWSMDNPENRPLLVNTEQQIKFSAAAGNSATGLRIGSPDLARPKGKATIHSVNSYNNSAPLIGLFDLKLVSTSAAELPPPGEWLLLYFYDEPTQEFRCEFSRPVALTSDGWIYAWSVRVLLEAINLDSAILQPDLFSNEDDGIDFNISRATGS